MNPFVGPAPEDCHRGCMADDKDRTADRDPARPPDAWRRRLHDAEAQALAAHLPAVIDAGQTVCAYVPVGSEPGSPELIDSLLRRGVRVLLPVARDDADGTPVPLQWGEYRPGELVEARFGLREPAAAVAAGRRDRPAATVVLVPALAVDRQGYGWAAARGSTTARCRWPIRGARWSPWSATTNSSTACPPNRTTCG